MRGYFVAAIGWRTKRDVIGEQLDRTHHHNLTESVFIFPSFFRLLSGAEPRWNL